MSYTYEYPKADNTTDCVVFGVNPQLELEVVLIKRKGTPYKGKWALPGGYLNVGPDVKHQGESLEACALRELLEETGVKVDYLEQLYTFGKPNRDPRGRVISVAYYALVRTTDHIVKEGSDAAKAQWTPLLEACRMKPADLAFDHYDILRMGIQRLQAKVRYEPVGFNLLPPKFTLSQLHRLYESILGRPIDKRNFYKRVLAMEILVEAGVGKTGGRPGKLYRFDKRAYNKAVREGRSFGI